MILDNKKEAFTIRFDGNSFNIPEGKFEVDTDLGNHIIFCARKWENVDISIVDGNQKPEVKPAVDPVEAPIEAPEETPEETPEAPEEVEAPADDAHEDEVKE